MRKTLAVSLVVLTVIAAWTYARPPAAQLKYPALPMTFAVEQGDGSTSEGLVRRLQSFMSRTPSAAVMAGGIATSDFEDLPTGPTGAVVLDAPAGVTAVLSGDLLVEEADANWPASFGERALNVEGGATLFLAGPVTGVGFSGTRRDFSDQDPTLRCLVVKSGFFTPTAILTFEMGDAVSPEYGNFAISLFSGQYGFCTISADLFDNIVILN